MKRFTDTDLWKKQWYMELTPAEKIAWQYITAECDNVGVWSTNFRLAEFVIGTQLDWEKFRLKCNGNIVVIKNGKWWLVDFIKFQYGELNEASPPHRSYIKLLMSHGLYDYYLKGYAKGIDTPQDKEKDQDQDKDKEEEKDQDQESECQEEVELIKHEDFVFLSEDQYKDLVEKYGEQNVLIHIQSLDTYLTNNEKFRIGGKKGYKDHYKTLRNWLNRDKIEHPNNYLPKKSDWKVAGVSEELIQSIKELENRGKQDA